MPGTAAAHNEPREVDPFDDAMTDEPRLFYGQVDVNAWTCVLEKGPGKIPYDPQLHDGRRTSTAIDFNVSPVDPTHKLIQRSMLNWTPDFRGIVRPSIETLAEKIAIIKDLTVGQFNPLKEISGMWISGEFVARPDNKEGETWTTLKFTDVYPTETACRAAAGFEGDGSTPGFDDAIPVQKLQGDSMRAQMAKFLPALFAQADKNYIGFLDLIEANQILAQYFDANSPEVLAFKAPF